MFGDSGRKRRQGNRKTAVGSAGEKGRGIFYFGSEVGVVVALAPDSSVVPSLSVAVPLVLPALPPALVVVAPVTVGSPGCCSKFSGGERERETEK